jgi:hypothetical protein
LTCDAAPVLGVGDDAAMLALELALESVVVVPLGFPEMFSWLTDVLPFLQSLLKSDEDRGVLTNVTSAHYKHVSILLNTGFV